MTVIDWYIEGDAFGNCNCAYGCPCQFEALPTQGDCRGFEAMHIDKGYFDETDLSGLRLAVTYAWPGPVFEGKGEMQVIIDENADAAQRRALETVLLGGETEEAATHWWVYRAMCDTVHDTLFKPIEYEVDIDGRSARVLIPGILESTGKPIRPPHSDGEHRARIEIPGGIEFEVAEVGSASTSTHADSAIPLNLSDSYGQFHRMRHSGSGVVSA